MTVFAASSAGRTLLAFDYGTQRIGVAIGNTLTATARPLTVIAARSADDAVGRAIDLIDAWHPDEIVVGRPLGGEGAGEPVANTRRAEKFARRLQGRSRLPVALVDERYSTFEARGRLREDREAGRSMVDPAHGDDSYAAVVILEQYLGQRLLGGGAPGMASPAAAGAGHDGSGPTAGRTATDGPAGDVNPVS